MLLNRTTLARTALATGFCLALLPFAAAQSLPPIFEGVPSGLLGTRTVAERPPITFLENSVIDAAGRMLVTSHEDGVIFLRHARLQAGGLLVAGKTVTGFANIAEDFADHAVWDLKLVEPDVHVMPWRIEDELKKLGANFIQAGLWRPIAVRDGNLITGQQNFSGAETARLVIDALGG